MTIRKALKNGLRALGGFAGAHLDSEVILSFVLKKDRAHILAHLDEVISDNDAKRFDELIKRRAKHEPAAYLIQNKEFYGRNFYVDKRVHIPKPATEDLINAVKGVLRDDFDGTIADIGTGSGCIAITLALELPKAAIIATDVSQDALDVARQNADTHHAAHRIAFLKGDLLSPVSKSAHIIIANLPYGWTTPTTPPSPPQAVGEIWTQDKEVFFQPAASYDGGKDGLELIKKLIIDLPHHLKDDGFCFLEFDPRQSDNIRQIAKNHNFNISIKKDTANFDRIVILAR